jgi:hypothetical protein
MITPFPFSKKPPVPLTGPLTLHDEKSIEENQLEWAHWLFQGVRARCASVVFQCKSRERSILLSDWQSFVSETFLPVLAPALIKGWKLAQHGDESGMVEADFDLSKRLGDEVRERSVTAGGILLHDTRGAKYQGALGKFRLMFDEGRASGHLAPVWSGLAAMFQIPPTDMLAEYLREEWLVATREVFTTEEPQGALGFSGLAQRVLHQSSELAFEESLQIVRSQ